MTIRDLVHRRNSNEGLSRHFEDNSLFSFQHDMNQLFDNFLNGFDLATMSRHEVTGLSTFSPRINVAETEQEIKVSAELPGMDEKDVTVEFDKDALVIKGEKKEEHEEKGKNWHRIEQSYGEFYRIVPIPVKVDGNKVKATFKKGLLNVTLPKIEDKETAKKKIEIITE